MWHRHLMIPIFPRTLSPAVSVITYKYTPLATLSPELFVRSQGILGPSVCSSFASCPETVKILIVVPMVNPAKVTEGCPACLSDRQGLGWTFTADKFADTKVTCAI